MTTASDLVELAGREAIAPCPFCGGEAIWTNRACNVAEIGCASCKACVWGAECESYDAASASAITAWNRRVALRERIPLPADGELSPEDAWRDLVEKDDRTSPADYPEMCLITFDELRDYMRSAAPLPADGGAREALAKIAERIITDSLHCPIKSPGTVPDVYALIADDIAGAILAALHPSSRGEAEQK